MLGGDEKGYLMAGDSSSDSSQTSSSTTQYQDGRIVADGGGIGVSGDGSSAYMSSQSDSHNQTTVNVTDGGAFDVANNAIQAIQKMGETAAASNSAGLDGILGFGKELLSITKNEQEMISKTQQGVEAAYKTAASISTGQENIVKVGLVVAGVVGFVALSSMARKG